MNAIGPLPRILNVVCWAAFICQPTVYAAAPTIKSQAPGFYRMMLGDFEITALNDGVVAYQTAQILPGASPDQIRTSLTAAGLEDPVGMSYNAFLINTGNKLVLIDVGTGGKVQDSPFFRGAGRLLNNLRSSGYRPEQIDEIFITHVGPDHIGGLTSGSERLFPNAMLRAAKNEVDPFLRSKQASTNDFWVKFRSDSFEPYVKAEKFLDFDDDVELVPGIRAMATPGHTPGHTSYIVESRGQRLIVLGDVLHVGAMQFTYPALPIVFDADQKAGISQRERLLKLAVDQDYWIAGAHLSFPGIGHVRRTQNGYAWAPINYTIPE